MDKLKDFAQKQEKDEAKPTDPVVVIKGQKVCVTVKNGVYVGIFEGMVFDRECMQMFLEISSSGMKFKVPMREIESVKLFKDNKKEEEDVEKETIIDKLKKALELDISNEELDEMFETPVVNNEISETKIKDFTYNGHVQYFTVRENGFERPDSFYKKTIHERIIHSGNRTICILEDGTKGVAKCDPYDQYDELKGIKIAYLRAKIKSLTKELKELTK